MKTPLEAVKRPKNLGLGVKVGDAVGGARGSTETWYKQYGGRLFWALIWQRASCGGRESEEGVRTERGLYYTVQPPPSAAIRPSLRAAHE
eukprot:1580457-Rhodomonas_salina.2